MKIVAGLGNPGLEYANTRHNAGVVWVEGLASKLESDYGWRAEKGAMVYKTKEIILAKPKDKFMNQSGEWVKWVVNYLGNRGDELWVAHDDLDLKLGEYKFQMGVGPKVHGGVNSVENILGDKNFWRVRLGIDNRDVANRVEGEEYVLERFSLNEKKILEGVISESGDEWLKSRI